MQIASIGAMSQMAPLAQVAPVTRAPVPAVDPANDGDADDGPAAGPILSATAPGVGNSVDISA